jgi:cell division protein FtsB
MEIGINWYLKYRLLKKELEKELEKIKLQKEILERRLKKYENNNTRTTRNRKDNNVVKFGRRIY